MQRTRIQLLIEIAMATSLAIIIEIIPFSSFRLWQQGGSISFSMLPILLLSLRWGWRPGALTGLIFGMLQIATGQAAGTIVHPVQGLIDYFIAFTVLGAAGFTAKQTKAALTSKQKTKAIFFITAGVLLGSSLRFMSHVLSGIIFFQQFAPEGQPVLLYSLLYNGSYMLPDALLCSFALSAVLTTSPILIRTS